MRSFVTLLLILNTLATGKAQAPASNEADQKFVHYIEPYGLVIIEKIEPGNTLYSLSRKYNLCLDSILAANPDLNPGSIPKGYPVNIPIDASSISFTPPEEGHDSLPLFYRVQPKETLYRISKVYLGTSPESLVALNPRINQSLSIGQVIHMGWYLPQAESSLQTGGSSNIKAEAGLYEVKDFTHQYEDEGQVLKEQKGLAFWKPGNMQSHYYVLHPTARVGSYMEVTNPMLHRTLTAKVAGNIPPGLYPSQVGLVVSPSVAKALGVLDQQFFAKWRFVE